MQSALSGTRSRKGCWTCRARKVKCDEVRPVCKNCLERDRDCDYKPRVKPRRQRRTRAEIEHQASLSRAASTSTVNGPSPVLLTSTLPLSSGSPSDASPDALKQNSSFRLPNDLKAEDWPIPLTERDCEALWHYAQDFVPRMALKTSKWTSYSFLLFLCTKHELLAHLVLAFSVRDMATDRDSDLKILAIEHYQTALSMFVHHLGSSEQHLWLTFPALWLFILYEQRYGEDPRILQRHLEGVRDVVAVHASLLFPDSNGGVTTMIVAGEERQRQILDRFALWTIYHDASAATFGFGGSLIELLVDRFPGSIARIQDSSSGMIGAAWGKGYPAEEALWDEQIARLERLCYDQVILQYEVTRADSAQENLKSERLLRIGRELKELEKEYSPILSAPSSYNGQRDDFISNSCLVAALFFATVLYYERKVYKVRPVVAISKTLQACAKLHEYEGSGYMWRVAWPMFIAALETDDMIYHKWVIDRFDSLQKRGENMRRAKVLLESVCKEQRITGQQVDFLSQIKSGKFEGFVI